MSAAAAGKFDPDSGNVFIKIMTDKEEQNHTIIHESFHRKDYEDYLAKGNEYINKKSYIESVSKKAKERLDKMGINEYNVGTISDYATDMYSLGRYDEVYTEYRTINAIKGK